MIDGSANLLVLAESMMSEPSSDRNPVEELAEEFLERFRQGERPSLTEYTRKYPDLASDIRELFPALVMLEDVRPASATAHAAEAKAGLPERQKLDRLGDYRILREVGRGGMGIVYEAEQESLGRHVALKVLSTHALLDARQLQRFQREARSAARLHHTNIVPVFGVGEQDNLHYYVMQFIHGQGLDQVLDQLKVLRARADGATDLLAAITADEMKAPSATAGAHSALAVAKCLLTGVFPLPAAAKEGAGEKVAVSGRPEMNQPGHGQGAAGNMAGPSSSAVHLPGQGEKSTLSDSGRPYWNSVARIGIQVAEALAYAHGQGTLHRDIKPSNLLLDTQAVVWVTDFGLAKASDSEDLTNTGDVVGTLRYMAPERFQGKADARSDVYALGLTLYELLTLRPAFGASARDRLLRQVMHEEPPRPRKLNPAVPRDLETVVRKATARDPAHRYQSAADLAEDLKRFRDDRPIRARPVGEIERLLRWCRRNPALAMLTTCFLVSLIVGIVGTSLKWREAEQRRDEAESEKQKVIRAERETSRQRDDAVDARKDTQRVLAGAMLDKGIALADQAQVSEGLFWMLEALKTTPDDAGGLVRAIRTNLAGWLRQTHRLEHVMARNRGVGICTFTPGDKHILTASMAGVEWWDVATGRPLSRAPVAEGVRAALAFSPDARHIITRSANGTGPGMAEIWRITPPEELGSDAGKGGPRFGAAERTGAPLPHPASVHCAVFTPDGKQVLTGCQDGIARWWDRESGKLLRSLEYEKKPIRRLALSPDGKLLAAACLEPSDLDAELFPGIAYVHDLTTGKRLAGPLAHRYFVFDIVFGPDGRTILTACRDGAARVWKAAGGQPIGQPMQHAEAVQAARFTPDGRTIVTGCRDGGVRFWDAATGQQLIGTLAVSRIAVSDLALSSDGARLALARDGFDEGQLDVCALGRGYSQFLAKGSTPSRTGDGMISAHPWWHRHVATFSPDSRLALTGGGDGYARLSLTASGRPAYLDIPGLGNPFRHSWGLVDITAFSPDGRRCATTSRPVEATGEVRLWDVNNGRLVALLPHMNYVAAVAFSPDGKLLATAGYDRHIHFSDAGTGDRVGKAVYQGDIVVQLAFSPDSKRIAASRTRDWSGSESVGVFDVATGQQTGVAIPGPGEIIRFTPDGKQLLTTAGLAIQRWDAATGLPQGTMKESGFITTLVFRPDGKMLLVGGSDGALRLRDAAAGTLVGVPMLARQRVTAAAFSPDPQGKLIVAGYGDGSARLWDRTTQKPLGPPVIHFRSISAVGFSADGRSFLTTDIAGNTRSWPVPEPATESVEQLAQRLQVHTGLEMVEGQAVVPITPADWNQRRERFVASQSKSSGENGSLAPLTPAEYHEARLRDAEQDREPFAALWHLDRLLATAPNDAKGWLYARRARAHARMRQFAEAEADLKRATARIAPGEIANWCVHGAADCRRDAQWAGALWFLDRTLAGTPGDWKFYADRAEVHEKLGHATERDADLARAVDRGPENIFLFNLINEYAGRGLWDKAKTALTKTTAPEPMPYALVMLNWKTLFAVKDKDSAKYRSLCAHALQRFGPEAPAPYANSVAWLCALAPDAVADYAAPVKLAEQALNMADPQERANFLNTLGAILYRAGRFKDAIASLEEGIRLRGQGLAQDWAFLAMAHHRLGDKEKARDLLAKVTKHQSGLGGRGWDYLEIEVLREEARALLDAKRGRQIQ